MGRRCRTSCCATSRCPSCCRAMPRRERIADAALRLARRSGGLRGPGGALRALHRHAALRHRASRPPMPSKKFLRAEPAQPAGRRPGLMAGVDEAGRGPLAGPVVAAAVILDERRADPRPQRLEAADRADARAPVRRDPRQGAVLSASARRASRRSTASTSCRRRCWRCAARSTGLRLHAGRSCSSTATSCRRCRWHAERSSAATRRCARSRPRRSSPRCTATGSASDLHDEHPQYGFAGTRAIRRRSTWRAARARRLPAPPAQLRAGARRALRTRAEDPRDQLARQPAARAGCAS